MAFTEKNAATPEQRKRALISAIALAAMAIGIYAVVIVKFFVYK
ncbi:MAG: hypothetical protein WA190_04960 [Usitatibacter sp.]